MKQSSDESINDRVVSISQIVTGMENMNGGNWSQEEKALLEQLDKSLEKEFAGFLNATHTDALRQWQMELEKHEQCGRDKHMRLTGDVQARQDDVKAKEEIHKLCRTSEKAWTEYNRHKTSTAKLHRVTKEDEDMCRSIASVDQKREAYKKKAKELRACDLEQISFEDSTCTWYTAKSGTCDGYDSCVATIDLAATKKKLEAEAVNRQELWKTIATVRCRIAHLLETFDANGKGQPSTFTKTDPCGDADNKDLQWKKNIDHLLMSLTIPTGDHNVQCSDHADLKVLPDKSDENNCQAWLKLKYQSWTTATIPSQCEGTCPSFVHSMAQRDPLCVDSDIVKSDGSGCSFYDHHPETCKLYDEAHFSAANLCCACGQKPPSKMRLNQWLCCGQKLVSPNGEATLIIQSDGNLVVYCAADGGDADLGPYGPGNAKWSADTNVHIGSGHKELEFRGVGLQVYFSESKKIVWLKTFHSADPEAELVLQDDGDLVLSASDVTWSLGSSCSYEGLKHDP